MTRRKAAVVILSISLPVQVAIIPLGYSMSPFVLAYSSLILLAAAGWAVGELASDRGESRWIGLLVVVPIVGFLLQISEVIRLIRPARHPTRGNSA